MNPSSLWPALLLLLLGTPSRGHAQQGPAGPAPVPTALPTALPTAPLAGPGSGFGQGRDTVLAVHHLFARKRGNGQSWAATGAAMAVDEGVGRRSQPSAARSATAAAFYGGVPLVAGVLKGERFSLGREQEIVQRYAQGVPIPFDVRRKLRPTYFRRTARDVQQGL